MMADDETLRGYEAVHGRPPAFEGSDGRAYSAGVFSEDDPGPDGRYGAALIFVRWSAENEPDGHLESGVLAYDADPAQAQRAVGRITLQEVKLHLDELIAARRRVEAE
ncbi:MAG: hypothetical protein AAB409_09300 [Gemmatimonadota bacterium]